MDKPQQLAKFLNTDIGVSTTRRCNISGSSSSNNSNSSDVENCNSTVITTTTTTTTTTSSTSFASSSPSSLSSSSSSSSIPSSRNVSNGSGIFVANVARRPSPMSQTELEASSAMLFRPLSVNAISPPTTTTTTPKKILSRNHNNTVFVTSFPSNQAELQLFRVMQKASLLLYYDTLLEMGGDDVQQLCDAGEEEFLEIMSLVGMASKPLHVRRLQKSLHEWATNPVRFRIPLLPGDDFDVEVSSPRVTSNHSMYNCDNGRSLRYSPLSHAADRMSAVVASPSLTPSPSVSPALSLTTTTATTTTTTTTLRQSQIGRLAAAAERMSKKLPSRLEPKLSSMKKVASKEVIEAVMEMEENDPRRMDEIRRYAAIYGRFDCKRKPEKPLTLHEVTVNEAAAQICRFVPALLTRRDELFPLARQIVKESGCYSAETPQPLTMKPINSLLNYDQHSTARSPPHSSPGSCSADRNSCVISSSSSCSFAPQPHSNDAKKLKMETNWEFDTHDDDNDNDHDHDDGDRQRQQDCDESNVIETSARNQIKIDKVIESLSRNSPRMSSGNDAEATADTFEHAEVELTCSSADGRSSLVVMSLDELQQPDVQYHPSNVDALQLQHHRHQMQRANNEENNDDNTEECTQATSPLVYVVAARGDNIIAVANPALALSPAMRPH